jgi:[ribosomal protein S5]-alanine N-acetyltransferase
MLSTHIPKPKA